MQKEDEWRRAYRADHCRRRRETSRVFLSSVQDAARKLGLAYEVGELDSRK